MSATPDSILADPKDRLIADLQRQLAERTAERDEAQQRLAERTAERDEALEQQTATAEVLQIGVGGWMQVSRQYCFWLVRGVRWRAWKRAWQPGSCD
jgi:hypothetical protein